MGSCKKDEIDIGNLDEVALMALNERIVQRLHFLHRQKTTKALHEAEIGSGVTFEGPDGKAIRGIVIRRNRKTVTVHSDDEKHWKISPSLLRFEGRQNLDGDVSKDGRVMLFAEADSR